MLVGMVTIANKDVSCKIKLDAVADANLTAFINAIGGTWLANGTTYVWNETKAEEIGWEGWDLKEAIRCYNGDDGVNGDIPKKYQADWGGRTHFDMTPPLPGPSSSWYEVKGIACKNPSEKLWYFQQAKLKLDQYLKALPKMKNHGSVQQRIGVLKKLTTEASAACGGVATAPAGVPAVGGATTPATATPSTTSNNDALAQYYAALEKQKQAATNPTGTSNAVSGQPTTKAEALALAEKSTGDLKTYYLTLANTLK